MARSSMMRRPRQSLLAQLRGRLIICIGCLIFCLLFSVAEGFYASASQQQLSTHKTNVHDYTNGLLLALINQETGLRGYIATDDQSFLDPMTMGEQDYANYLQKLRTELTSGGYNVTIAALSQIENSVNEWTNSYKNVQLANMRSGNLDAARAEAINTQGQHLFDTIRDSISRLQLNADRDLATAQSNTNIINWSIIGATLLLMVLVVLWMWYTFSLFTRVQREQMDNLKEASVAFGAGDLTVQVPEGADSEFNELGRTFNSMVARLREQQQALKDRDILEYVQQLNSLMTESLDLQTLMQTIQQRLVQLLDVQVAAFYRFDAQEQTLKLFAALGAEVDGLVASVAMGEGLIGRAARERLPLMVSNRKQKDDTFQIKTLMGAVLPSSLYHLPLVQGKELLGVMVLGSVYPMSGQTRNVLNVISSNLATAVHNAASYERIQKQALELAAYAHQQEQSNKALLQKHEEMTVLNSALVEANRVRSQFLSTMSHELRTPLTSIIGFAQMILRSANKNPLSPRQAGNVERILKNSQHLLSLINDVLDLAKIEAGRMDINADEIDLRDLIESVVEETKSMAVGKRLSLTMQMEEDLGGIETDPRKLRQILLNLISNALKFTEKGSVEVSAKREVQVTEDQDKIERVIIAVKDTGIGIPLEKQEHIFEAFYQADNSNSRNYGGTGLGLSIVHELTTLLGGKVEFQSEPGVGSTFSIVLPAHLRDQRFIQNTRLYGSQSVNSGSFYRPGEISMQALGSGELEALDHAETDGDVPYLVVAIDDNPDVLELIAASLEQTPYRVVGVQDPAQAVAVIQELQPSAITLDIMMPQINGWQILHQLKSNPETASIPVILLTVLEDRSAGYVLGADEYLVKPVARDALLRVLQQLTSRSEERRGLPGGDQGETQPGDDEKEPLRPIMLVHDEPDIHKLVEKIVQKKEPGLLSTSSGQDVMAIIEKAHPEMLMLFVKVGPDTTSGEHKSVVISGSAVNAPEPSSPTQDVPGEATSASDTQDGEQA